MQYYRSFLPRVFLYKRAESNNMGITEKIADIEKEVRIIEHFSFH